MRKTVLSAMLAAVMVTSLLVGCGASKTSQSDETANNESVSETNVESKTEGAKATVRMWTFLDPTNTTNGRSIALQQMINEFERDNPGTTVLVEPQDYNTMTAKFLAATTTGDAPDIIWCARDELCGVLNAGALEPLENLFLGDWSEEEIDDISDIFYQFGERDGKHYTLGLSKNAIGLYYREDLLKDAGIEVPDTFDELMEAAEKLTGENESGMQRYGLGQVFSTESADPQLIVNYLYDKQGKLFNDDGTAAWSTDAGVEAMQWIKSCIDKGVTPAEAVNTTNEDSILEFEAGKYAMLLCGGVRMPSIREAANYDSATIQLAVVPGGCSFDGWFVGVWSASPNKEAAGKFLEKMYSPESDELWVTLGGQAPVRKSTLDHLADYFEKPENQYMKVMSEAFSGAIPLNNSYTVNGYKFDFNRAVQNVISSGMDPKEALLSSEKDFNKMNGR